ncbi:MAG TPA: hypothetical protein VHD32_16375 [Candidatus Didemnitutus sp.]|nr:hypothetical protein [Candidatus Didemnitutus sp.]
MKKPAVPHWALWGGLCIAFVFMACCTRDDGSRTKLYLETYISISHDLHAKLAVLPRIERPVAPTTTTKGRPVAPFGPEMREIRLEEEIYWNLLAQRFHVLTDIYGEAQRQIGNIGARGVDPQAAQAVALRQTSMGKRMQLFLEEGRLAELTREGLKEKASPPDLAPLFEIVSATVQGNVPGLVASSLSVIGKSMEKRAAKEEALRNQAEKVAEALFEAQKAAVDLRTAGSELRASLEQRFPDQDWSFLGQ